ncbi:MAG: hypothetical protein ACRDMY_12730, partial [Gaiellaceae bacterium]
MKRHRMRGFLLALVSSLALALAGAGAAAAQPSGSAAEVERLVESIRKHRAVTWHWQRIKGNKRLPSVSLVRISDPERLAALRDLWKRRAERRLRWAKNPRSRPSRWCMRPGAPSSPGLYAAVSIAITSSGCCSGGASVLAI